MSARCFIALRLGAEAHRALALAIGELSKRRSGVRWVKAENVHLTLVFLGAVERARLPEIEAGLETVELGPPLQLGLAGTGQFPPRGAPRVLWAGLDGDLEGLAALQERVAVACEALGFERERRPFRPHLTLGRVKKRDGIERVVAAMGELELRSEPEVVGGFCLFESRLEPTGAEYVVVREFGS